MCKYCQDLYSQLIRVTDGSQVIELSLLQCVDSQDRIVKNVLDLSLSCKIGEAGYTVKDKEIRIKYCPFCGEKL